MTNTSPAEPVDFLRDRHAGETLAAGLNLSGLIIHGEMWIASWQNERLTLTRNNRPQRTLTMFVQKVYDLQVIYVNAVNALSFAKQFEGDGYGIGHKHGKMESDREHVERVRAFTEQLLPPEEG